MEENDGKNDGKKLVLLYVIIMILSLAPVTCSATTKATTYQAAKAVCQAQDRTVYLKDQQMISRAADGEETVLIPDLTVSTQETYTETSINRYCFRFIVRDDQVICSETPLDPIVYRDWENVQHLYSLNKDGTKETISEGAGDLIGGYGDELITQRRDTGMVCRINGAEITELFTAEDGSFFTVTPKGKLRFVETSPNKRVCLFDGKLYYDNKVYDLDSNKETAFKAVTKIATSDYLYYVTPAKKLIRMNRGGKKTSMAKNVTEVIGGSNDGDVIYRAKDKTGKMSFFRAVPNGKIFALTTQARLLKKAGLKGTGSAQNSFVYIAVMAKGKVYIDICSGSASRIARISKAGGKIRPVDSFDWIPVLESIGNEIHYVGVGKDDEPYVFFR